jgi:EAL domain-containing protein (putative c-di-GMP-specific phosphodiesterase class I)/GGDEF domain-containing protein
MIYTLELINQKPVQIETTHSPMTTTLAAPSVPTSVQRGLEVLPLSTILTRLQNSIANMRWFKDYHFSVLLLELDDFNKLQAKFTCNKAALEDLIGQVVQNIQNCFTENNFLARLESGSFIIISEGHRQTAQITQLADRIVQALDEPFEQDEQLYLVSASMGLVLGNPTYQAPEKILQDARGALNAARENGSGYYKLFDAEIEQATKKQQVMEAELVRAIQQKQFVVFYQAIVAAGSNQLIGFESLIRWQHPSGELLAPAMFLEAAETANLLARLDWFVLKEACVQLKSWREQTGLPLTINVNISHWQFLRPDLADKIEKLLQELDLPAESLHIELTEQIMAKETIARRIIQRLKEVGVKIYLDDFGTGCTNFDKLKLPIDALKIDRSLICNIEHNPTERELVRFLIERAHQQGFEVVVEGVETARQASLLENMACDYFQGYYLAVPVTQLRLPPA